MHLKLETKEMRKKFLQNNNLGIPKLSIFKKVNKFD